MTLELFLRILPGLVLVIGGLIGAAILLPDTLRARREDKARKKAVKVGHLIEGGNNVRVKDVTKAAEIFADVCEHEQAKGVNPDLILTSGFAAVIAYARSAAPKNGA